MDQLLTTEFWKTEVAFVMGAPWIIIPLLIIAGFVGWWFRGRFDDGEIRALKAQLTVRDERLQLARDNEKDVREKLDIATAESLTLQNEVKLYTGRGALPGFVTIQSSVDRTIAAIGSANASSVVLGRTLTIGERVPDEPIEPITSLSDKAKSKD